MCRVCLVSGPRFDTPGGVPLLFPLISSRYGFVHFSNSEDAKEGLKMDGVVYKGRFLNVNLAENMQPIGK